MNDKLRKTNFNLKQGLSGSGPTCYPPNREAPIAQTLISYLLSLVTAK